MATYVRLLSVLTQRCFRVSAIVVYLFTAAQWVPEDCHLSRAVGHACTVDLRK